MSVLLKLDGLNNYTAVLYVLNRAKQWCAVMQQRHGGSKSCSVDVSCELPYMRSLNWVMKFDEFSSKLTNVS